MRYYLYGPMELPRGDDNLLNFVPYDRSTMWSDFEAMTDIGLSDACGCYVFAIRAGRGIRPWYVGKAERQSFKRESLTEDKIKKYNEVLSSTRRGTPFLYFYARTTSGTHRWSKPSTARHRDIDLLERLLIGAALKRNKNLINIRDTDLLKKMVVPGFINNPPGKLTAAATEMRQLMGY